MALSTLTFYLFALITVGSGVVVVFANRLIHAVFALLFTFFGTAGLYVFLGADFVAGVRARQSADDLVDATRPVIALAPDGARQAIVVDLPDPDEPMIATKSPSLI